MKLLGDVGHVESYLGPFGGSVTVGPFGYSGNLEQDSCLFCAKCTTGLEIILDPPDRTPR
jgi:hypothetical protein